MSIRKAQEENQTGSTTTTSIELHYLLGKEQWGCTSWPRDRVVQSKGSKHPMADKQCEPTMTCNIYFPCLSRWLKIWIQVKILKNFAWNSKFPNSLEKCALVFLQGTNWVELKSQCLFYMGYEATMSPHPPSRNLPKITQLRNDRARTQTRQSGSRTNTQN